MRALTAFFLFACGALLAETPNRSMLVSTEELARKLSDPSVVVLHVGSAKDYETGHIPGARLITLADVSITNDKGLTLELPPVDQLTAALGKLGIEDKSQVVIYPGTPSIQSATRVWFTFDYLGLGDRTSLLDGGLSLWRSENRPLSTETPKWEPKTLTATGRPELIVSAEYLHSHAKVASIAVIDARTPEFYSGASAGNMPRAGHIPGARNAPFSSFFDDNKKLRSPDELRAVLGAASEASTVVTYCHIGQQATVPYFVARYLGLQPRLYDGSFQEWSRRPELPVE